MKGASEGKVREALDKINADDMLPLTWWKPPDDARNWKPADYLVWFADFRPDWQMAQALVTGSAMIEVKDNDQSAGLPFSELRLTQRAWIRQAGRIGLPYLLVVWWRKWQDWTVSDATKVLAFIEDEQTPPIKSVHRTQLLSVMGVNCTSANLASTLAAALRGELS